MSRIQGARSCDDAAVLCFTCLSLVPLLLPLLTFSPLFSVSLKAKLSAPELFTLIMDVRRRVEMDDTGSKLGARQVICPHPESLSINCCSRFLSSLLPPTPETTAHVLARSGALSTRRESETHDSIDPILAKSPRSSHNLNPPSTHGNIERPIAPSDTPHDGLTRATAIPIESPAPRPAAFPTPPSSHAHESDLSSRASQSSPNSSVHRLQPAPVDLSNSLAMSRSTLDVDPLFNALLAETRRYLSGPDFAYALGCALDRATEVLMDGLRARIFVDSTSAVNLPGMEEAPGQSKTGDPAVGASSENEDEIKVRLAGMLPGLTRWCQLALNATPNELVDVRRFIDFISLLSC